MAALSARAVARTAVRASTVAALAAPVVGRRALATVAVTAPSAASPAAAAVVAASTGASAGAGGQWSATMAVAFAAATLGSAVVFAADAVDYDAVRKAIAEAMDDNDYDDGSLGPVYVRLAWHAAGTYSCFSKDGGSNGATMRFKPESTDGANAGLDLARARLEPIKAKFPGISYADLWTLAGVVAIEEMGGPKIKWVPGRTDAPSGETCPPNGRLPDAARGSDHIRAIFYRMGFNDREIVALLGAHSVGRCHTNRSGFDGPWTRAPTTFSNEYFRLLKSENWTQRKWTGPQQFVNASSGSDLMMLPADLALLTDPEFRKYVDLYANDEKALFEDFAKAFSKLLELGVPRKCHKKSFGSRVKGWFGLGDKKCDTKQECGGCPMKNKAASA